MSPSSNGKSKSIVIAVGGAVVLVVAVAAFMRGSAGGGGSAAQSAVGASGKAVAARSGDCTPTHCITPECEACSTQNCNGPEHGCDRLATASERKMCEEVYACFNDPANKCVAEGDSLKCWCGTNPTTCVTSNEAPTQANGPCREKVFEGVASRDAATVWQRFVDKAYPVSYAANLTLCRGTFCKAECKIP